MTSSQESELGPEATLEAYRDGSTSLNASIETESILSGASEEFIASLYED